ncbi:MAG: DUF4291 domain-containing protein [Vulcanimicrobiota bacterium]
MIPQRQIRADYDRDTIVVYQAYRPAIAEAALAAGRFVAPFSFCRMTWIKPSFLWMMERCGYASKAGQTRVLAVRITRTGWEKALAAAVLTHPGPGRSADQWRQQLEQAPIRVQWDPERSLRGAKLNHRSIQVGIGRQLSQEYANHWTVSIEDRTPLTQKLRQLRLEGRWEAARQLLPKERPYPIDEAVAQRLEMF